jgi:hypothetical protein
MSKPATAAGKNRKRNQLQNLAAVLKHQHNKTVINIAESWHYRECGNIIVQHALQKAIKYMTKRWVPFVECIGKAPELSSNNAATDEKWKNQ